MRDLNPHLVRAVTPPGRAYPVRIPPDTRYTFAHNFPTLLRLELRIADLEQQAVDFIMPDIPKCGGLSECRKIAEMADIYSIPFAPHNVSSPIGTMASAHVCATVPNFLVLEFHWFNRDYWKTITDGGEIIKNGKIALNDRPGIGLELNYDVAKQYQYPGTTWFE